MSQPDRHREGDAPEERCRECHIQRKAEGRDAARLHEIHITKNYINCFKCHNKMEHGKETTHFSRSIDLSCRECHSATHNTAKDMYMGIGSDGHKRFSIGHVRFEGAVCRLSHDRKEHPRETDTFQKLGSKEEILRSLP